MKGPGLLELGLHPAGHQLHDLRREDHQASSLRVDLVQLATIAHHFARLLILQSPRRPLGEVETKRTGRPQAPEDLQVVVDFEVGAEGLTVVAVVLIVAEAGLIVAEAFLIVVLNQHQPGARLLQHDQRQVLRLPSRQVLHPRMAFPLVRGRRLLLDHLPGPAPIELPLHLSALNDLIPYHQVQGHIQP